MWVICKSQLLLLTCVCVTLFSVSVTNPHRPLLLSAWVHHLDNPPFAPAMSLVNSVSSFTDLLPTVLKLQSPTSSSTFHLCESMTRGPCLQTLGSITPRLQIQPNSALTRTHPDHFQICVQVNIAFQPETDSAWENEDPVFFPNYTSHFLILTPCF